MAQLIKVVLKPGRGNVVLFSALALLPLLGPVVPARSAAPVAPIVVPAGPVRESLQAWRRRTSDSRIQVVDSLLAARIDELRASAPSFATAWDQLERSRVPIVIGTRAQLEEILPADVRRSNGWAGMSVAWNGPYTRSLDRAAVAVRVDWLRQLHQTYHTPPGAFEEALDGLIIHEVYGHLVPVVAARDAGKQCADPRGRQRLAESCVGKREQFLKAERLTVLASRTD
jgi:hypothetical protein